MNVVLAAVLSQLSLLELGMHLNLRMPLNVLDLLWELCEQVLDADRCSMSGGSWLIHIVTCMSAASVKSI